MNGDEGEGRGKAAEKGKGEAREKGKRMETGKQEDKEKRKGKEEKGRRRSKGRRCRRNGRKSRREGREKRRKGGRQKRKMRRGRGREGRRHRVSTTLAAAGPAARKGPAEEERGPREATKSAWEAAPSAGLAGKRRPEGWPGSVKAWLGWRAAASSSDSRRGLTTSGSVSRVDLAGGVMEELAPRRAPAPPPGKGWYPRSLPASAPSLPDPPHPAPQPFRLHKQVTILTLGN